MKALIERPDGAMVELTAGAEVSGPRDGADLIRVALDKGADPATLERLMGLHERWEANQAKKACTVAMAKFHAECPAVLPKDAAVNFGGGRAAYRHATLGAIMSVVTPHLSRNGLSVDWETNQEGKLITVACVVTHAQGHSKRVPLSAAADDSGKKNHIQAIGSVVTYLQRYTLQAALGIATTADDDGQAAGLPVDKPAPTLASEKQRDRLRELAEHPAMRESLDAVYALADEPRLTQGRAGAAIAKAKTIVEDWEATHHPDPETGELADCCTSLTNCTTPITCPTGPPPDEPEQMDREPGQEG